MDDLARRYLLLALRLDRLSPGFVDSYVGPPELREIALAEPVPLAAELHDESLALADLAAALAGGDAATGRRRLWFAGQLRAMSALARRAAGEDIGYLDLVEQLLGVPVRPVPDAELASVGAALSEALPGREPLSARAGRLRDALRVPPGRVLGALEHSAGRFRAVTRRDFEILEPESIDWEETHDRPWGASARFAGAGRTRIEINIDLPVQVGLVASLAAHEGYPGHHAESVTKERILIGLADLGEATLRTTNSPEALLGEGAASVAREVVMSDRELEGELRTIGAEVGVDGDWAAAVAVDKADAGLRAAVANASIMLHHDTRPEPEVRAYLSDVGLMSPERVDHTIRILRDPVGRTYRFTYPAGARLVRSWLELTGQTAGYWRLLSEQLSPAALLADLEPARSPVENRA